MPYFGRCCLCNWSLATIYKDTLISILKRHSKKSHRGKEDFTIHLITWDAFYQYQYLKKLPRFWDTYNNIDKIAKNLNL